MTKATDTASAWDRYWAYGNLHSFSQVSGGNYGGRIAAFWHERFATLGNGTRVLDIATGNGAIALMALAAADRGGVAASIHGTDKAAIDPVTQLSDAALRDQARRIHFHPNTRAENLPFDEAGMDLVCSQFGLEYAEVESAIAEIARVLAVSGELALVMHHRDSRAVQAAEREASAMDFVIDEARAYGKARNFLRAWAQEPRRRRSGQQRLSPKTARKRHTLDQAIQRIETAARQSADGQLFRGPLNYVHEVLAMTARIPPEQALDWLEEGRQRVAATRQRLRQMQSAASDDHAISTFGERLSGAGFTQTEIEELVEADGTLLGWQVRARRCDPA